MGELVSFFGQKPLKSHSSVVTQLPYDKSSDFGAYRGALSTNVVYVQAPFARTRLLVPFAQFDYWSLESRFNEAIRIVSSLGAAEIKCKTYSVKESRTAVRARGLGPDAEFKNQRYERSGFDFYHKGTGSEPVDPGELTWPNEPGFKAACESVMKNGGKEVSLSIESTREYDIHGNLAKRLMKVGFELGASRRLSFHTVLDLKATFPGSDLELGPLPEPAEGVAVKGGERKRRRFSS